MRGIVKVIPIESQPQSPELWADTNTVQHVQNHHFQKDLALVFKTNYRLIQVERVVECSAILLTFIKLPFVIKIFILCIC